MKVDYDGGHDAAFTTAMIHWDALHDGRGGASGGGTSWLGIAIQLIDFSLPLRYTYTLLYFYEFLFLQNLLLWSLRTRTYGQSWVTVVNDDLPLLIVCLTQLLLWYGHPRLAKNRTVTPNLDRWTTFSISLHRLSHARRHFPHDGRDDSTKINKDRRWFCHQRNTYEYDAVGPGHWQACRNGYGAAASVGRNLSCRRRGVSPALRRVSPPHAIVGGMKGGGEGGRLVIAGSWGWEGGSKRERQLSGYREGRNEDKLKVIKVCYTKRGHKTRPNVSSMTCYLNINLENWFPVMIHRSKKFLEENEWNSVFYSGYFESNNIPDDNWSSKLNLLQFDSTFLAMSGRAALIWSTRHCDTSRPSYIDGKINPFPSPPLFHTPLNYINCEPVRPVVTGWLQWPTTTCLCNTCNLARSRTRTQAVKSLSLVDS